MTPSTNRPFRRIAMPSLPSAFASIGLILLAACQTEVFGGKDTYSSRVETTDYAQQKIDAGPRKIDVFGPGQKDPAAGPVALFSDAVMHLNPRPASVACLPLVTYDLRTNKPWVSEMGLGVADAVARSLREQGFGGDAFATADVGLRLAQANVARSSFLTLEHVSANAQRLGADVVVFGTIKRRDRVGALDRDVLTCELQAYDVPGRRIATSTRWEIPSDDTSYRQAWDLAQAESSWAEDSRYAMPSGRPGLAAELQRLSDDLASALAGKIDPAKLAGSVYVAPLDVAAFVPQLATLRSAQGAFASEISRRAEDARAANALLDTSGTIVLDGTEYPNFQAAEAHMTKLGTAWQATPAAHFAQGFSSGLADALRARTAPSGRAVNDLAAVSPVDRALIDGELSQGGLAKSFAARDALRAAEVGLVVAPRLERIGDTFQIRVDAYELADGTLLGGAAAPIAPDLVAELERALGTGGAGSASVPRTTGQWSSVYDSVKSGVVQVAGSQGMGSGFVVRSGGLVLTNQHVVVGAGADLTVSSEGAGPLPARLVAEDPYWDLALLQVDGLPASCRPFVFADDVPVGTEVAVLGHPRDSSGWVLTPGYVSSTTELVSTVDDQVRAALMYTCPTRRGSSGSPVLLADGRVAAVHAAGRAGQSLSGGAEVTELTGFALGVPAREARRFAEKSARP